MEKKENIFKKLFSIFFTFLKIGAFTFGGGYAMISIVERDIVDNKKWLTQDEMTNIIAIAEATPGVIALNTATYVGAKVGGFLGAFLASVAVMLPSIIIIVLISLGIEKFSSNNYFRWAFMGIKAAVAALILNAAFRFTSVFKKLKEPIYYVVFIVALVLSLLSGFRVIRFDVVYIILGAAVIGIIYGAAKRSQEKKHLQNIQAKEEAKLIDTNNEESTQHNKLIDELNKKSIESDKIADLSNRQSIDSEISNNIANSDVNEKTDKVNSEDIGG